MSGGDDFPISSLFPPGVPGVIGLCSCPGVRHGRFRPELLSSDLDEVERWGTTALLCLLLENEIDLLPLERLIYEVRRRGIVCVQLEMPDEATPEGALEGDWERLRARVVQALRNGERLLIPCTEGRLRTGRVAAWLMIEGGATPDVAIEAVEAALPGSINTAAEMASIRNYARRV